MNPMNDAPENRLFDAADLPGAKSLFVRDLRDAQDVDMVLLVKERTLAQKRNGSDYLRLKVCDCTGTLDAMVWDGARDMHELAQPGMAIRVRGRFEISERYGAQLILQAASPAQEGDYRLADLMDAPAASVEQMEADLRRLIGTVRNPYLAQLLDALFGRGLGPVAAVPQGPGGEVLPPGLSARAARAFAVGGPGRERGVELVRGHRPRRGGHRSADPRHRQDRGLRDRSLRDRPDGRRQAPRRDPARLLHRAHADRAHQRLSRRTSRARCCTSCSPTTACSRTAAR